MKYLIYLISRIFCNYSDLKENIKEAVKNNEVSFRYEWNYFVIDFKEKNSSLNTRIKFTYFKNPVRALTFSSIDLDVIVSIKSNFILRIQQQVSEEYKLFVANSSFSEEHVLFMGQTYFFIITRNPQIKKTSKKLKIEDL